MMAKTLERINQSVWELREKVRLNPASYDYRKDLLNFWTDSKIFIERRSGVPEPQRSFLMLQQREAVGCLLIHGAGGSPEEMRPMADYLFRQGFTVLGIRLPLDPNYSDAGFSEYVKAIFSRSSPAPQPPCRCNSNQQPAIARSEITDKKSAGPGP